MRILPPTSEPTPSAAPSAASSAPSPPDEPPGVCAADHGLHVRPQRGLELSKARSVCGTFVLAKIMAPAARSFETTYTVRIVRIRARGWAKRWVEKGCVRGEVEGHEVGKTYGGIVLGWLVGPLCVPNSTVESLHVDYSILHPISTRDRKKKAEEKEHTLVLRANRHAMQRSLQAPCRSKFRVQPKSLLLGLLEEHYKVFVTCAGK